MQIDETFVVRLWMALDPGVAAQPDTMLAILDDMRRLAELQSEFVLRVSVGKGARSYRSTERGWHAVRNAVIRKPRQDIIIIDETRDDFDDMREFVAHINASTGEWDAGNAAVSVSISWVGSTGDDPRAIAEHLRTFARTWIAAVPATSGYVSDKTADWYRYTAYEREVDAPQSSHWPVANMPARGAFWANYLGRDLCNRLGGVEYVLVNAPLPIREPLGDGVWLQSGVFPPASEEQIADLLAFLQPVLVRPDPAPTRWQDPQEYAPVMPEELPPDDAPGVSVDAFPDAEISEDLPFTVYLVVPLTDAVQHALADAVNRWNQAGEAQAYGGSGFATLVGPHVDPDEASMRWMVDLGWCDPEVAVAALARVLYAVPGQPVSRLVIGWETVE